MEPSEMRDNFQALIDQSATNPTVKAILDADQTTSIRCNWCSHPIIFHSYRRTVLHSFLCGIVQIPDTYESKPLYVRPPDHDEVAR